MSTQAPKEISCDGKDPLPTLQRAELIASRMSSRRSKRIRPYKCVFCGFYHVGEVNGRPGIKTPKPRTPTRRA